MTAAEFRRFVRETGYVTFCERPLDPDDFPGANPDSLVPGALVFRKTAGPVDCGTSATGGSTFRARLSSDQGSYAAGETIRAA